MKAATKQPRACSSCGRPIILALGPDNPGGPPPRWMPIDAEPALGGTMHIYAEVHTGRTRWKHEVPAADRLAYVPHWRTCPNADEHRKQPQREVRPERPRREQLDLFGGGAAPRPLHADDGNGGKRS
jgi:hypothetical protein